MGLQEDGHGVFNINFEIGRHHPNSMLNLNSGDGVGFQTFLNSGESFGKIAILFNESDDTLSLT